MRFGEQVACSTRRDNHESSGAEKIQLRRNVLDVMGADRVAVLDLFAGTGAMHDAVWHQANCYVGCDLKWAEHQARVDYVCDNRRLLRTLNLDEFNVFDLDAYGSPWEQVIIIAGRRRALAGPDDAIGLVLTDGAGMNARFGGINQTMASIAGVSSDLRGAGKQKNWKDLTIRALRGAARRMGGTVTDLWFAEGANHRAMIYSAAIIRGQAL